MDTQKINLFKSLFRGRLDCFGANNNCIKQPLMDMILLQHINGHRRIGVYMILTDSCHFACIDIDREGNEPLAVEDTKEIYNTSMSYGLTGYIERSKGKGYHIFYFFSELVLASKVRTLLQQIQDDSHIEKVEIFPKQDRITANEYGNYINLPLFKQDLPQRTAFIDPVSWTPYQDQWQFLSTIKKISLKEIDDIISINNIPTTKEAKSYHNRSGAIERTPQDTDDMITEFIDRALENLSTKGRNDSGYELAMQLRDHDVPILEAEDVLKRYQSQVRNMKDHEYPIDEAMASLDSAYKEAKRDSWWKPKLKANNPDSAVSYQTDVKYDTMTKACDIYHVSYRTLMRWIKDGKIESKLDGDKRLVRCDIDIKFLTCPTDIIGQKGDVIGQKGECPIQELGHVNKFDNNVTMNVSDEIEAEPIKNNISKYFADKKFVPYRLAKDLMDKYDFIYSTGELYIYLNGVYKPYGVDFIKQECYKILGEGARMNHVNEVVANIQYTNLIASEKLNTHKHLINLENGIYDTQTEKLLPHSKHYLSTIRIPVIYNPDADYSFISDWLDSTLGDAECIQLACELFGYCLIPDTTMSKAFMLVGSGANGKSTFLTVLENFIGNDNVSKVPLQELSDHRFKRAELFGKLVNLFADLDNRALESTTYFKTIVSGDTIEAERKNQQVFFFKPFATLVFSANEIPRSRDRSFAYYRRWCIIPFERQFMGADDKKGLAIELSKPENLSALLNGALSELKNVMKRQSFSEPGKVKNALNEYEKQNDPVKAFVDECCQLNPLSRVERGSLYDSFCRYCNETGFKTVTNRNFYQRMRIFKEVKELQQDDGKRVFIGINFLQS